jgi:hypothetical protein
MANCLLLVSHDCKTFYGRHIPTVSISACFDVPLILSNVIYQFTLAVISFLVGRAVRETNERDFF